MCACIFEEHGRMERMIYRIGIQIKNRNEQHKRASFTYSLSHTLIIADAYLRMFIFQFLGIHLVLLLLGPDAK